ADDSRPRVENNRLPGCDTGDARLQRHLKILIKYLHRGPDGMSVRPHLYLTRPHPIRWLTRPGGPGRTNDLDRQCVTRTDRDGICRRSDGEHEPRLTVLGWRPEPKTSPLSDGEAVRSGMLADLHAGEVHDVAWSAT